MVDTQERAIISEIRDGKTEHYRFFVERYHRGLITHLYNLVGDEQTAEDIAQDAFIRAYTKLNQYDERYAFSTWLYKIANNIAYRHMTQQKPSTDIDVLAEVLPDEKLTLPELADKAMTQQTVQMAIKKLPIAYQQAIALYYWDGFSYEEIAEIMEKPIGTIRTWLYRAKEGLRKELYGQI